MLAVRSTETKKKRKKNKREKWEIFKEKKIAVREHKEVQEAMNSIGKINLIFRRK